MTSAPAPDPAVAPRRPPAAAALGMLLICHFYVSVSVRVTTAPSPTFARSLSKEAETTTENREGEENGTNFDLWEQNKKELNGRKGLRNKGGRKERKTGKEKRWIATNHGRPSGNRTGQDRNGLLLSISTQNRWYFDNDTHRLDPIEDRKQGVKKKER